MAATQRMVLVLSVLACFTPVKTPTEGEPTHAASTVTGIHLKSMIPGMSDSFLVLLFGAFRTAWWPVKFVRVEKSSTTVKKSYELAAAAYNGYKNNRAMTAVVDDISAAFCDPFQPSQQQFEQSIQAVNPE